MAVSAMMPRSGSVSLRLPSARLRNGPHVYVRQAQHGCSCCMHMQAAQILPANSLQAPVEALQILLASH